MNRGERKVWVQMNVVPRSTGNTNSGTRELTLKCKLKCYFKPMNNPLGVSPSKGKQGTTRGKEKNLLTSVGIEPTTYGLDLPSLCRLSYKVAQRKSGTILDCESRRRESMGTNEHFNLHFRVNSLVPLFVFPVLRGTTFKAWRQHC